MAVRKKRVAEGTKNGHKLACLHSMWNTMPMYYHLPEKSIQGYKVLELTSWISISLSGKIFRHSLNQTIKNALRKGQKSNTVDAIGQRVGPQDRFKNFPQDNAPNNYPYQ